MIRGCFMKQQAGLTTAGLLKRALGRAFAIGKSEPFAGRADLRKQQGMP